MWKPLKSMGWLWAFVSVLLTAGAADAAELVMFRRDGCPWCLRWEREVGPIYPKTDLSRRAPLRIVDLDRDRSEVGTLRSPIRFTPTFVLMDQGREVGRLEGYPGEDFFWGLLERLFEKLPPQRRESWVKPSSYLGGEIKMDFAL